MSRFIPSLEQVGKARCSLPNPFAVEKHIERGCTYKVMAEPTKPARLIDPDARICDMKFNVLEFRLEVEKLYEPNGYDREIRQWVYTGEIRC